MAKVALFIRHKTQPGKRDEVRRVWERHMRPNIASNPGHEAYFYCFDENDADTICAFQQYADSTCSADFLKTESYAAYLKEVEPLLATPPQVTSLALDQRGVMSAPQLQIGSRLCRLPWIPLRA